MAINVSGSAAISYPPHPAGQFAAVCIDVADLGMVETTWGPKHRVKLRFYTGAPGAVHPDNGDPLFVDDYHNMTLGSAEKPSNLRKRLEAWRGKPFTPEEEKLFDLESLIGVGCYLQLVHNQLLDGSKTYCNIQSIMRLPSGVAAPNAPADYVRQQDREYDDAAAPAAPAAPDLPEWPQDAPGQPAATPTPPLTEPDDDLPF